MPCEHLIDGAGAGGPAGRRRTSRPTTPAEAPTARPSGGPKATPSAGPATPTDAPDLFVAVVLDRSGSMAASLDDTLGAFDTFVADLRADEGKTLMTLVQFDSQSIDVVFDALDISKVGPLRLRPRGMTPLLDAVGRTLASAEARAAELGWQGRVLVAIITDGHENASSEWTRAAVAHRIAQLEQRGWGFVYLGAHPDAFDEANGLGLSDGQSLRWMKGAMGARAMGESLAEGARGHRRALLDQKRLIHEKYRLAMEEAERAAAQKP